MQLLENNRLRSAKSNYTSRQTASHHPIIRYFPIHAHPAMFYYLLNNNPKKRQHFDSFAKVSS